MITDSYSDKPGLLLDTNILTHISSHKHQGPAQDGLIQRMTLDYTPWICLQNLAEFWAVATRDRERNGLGLTPSRASEMVTGFRKEFGLLYETENTAYVWETLCSKYQISGARAHDVRLAALALSNQIDILATFNKADFSSITEIRLLNLES